jgi:class 3 adenylate cyclase
MENAVGTPHGARLREERRLVTVLFADVCDSTDLGRSIDPEEVRALLGRFFGIAREAIEARGGRLEKYIGDAAMAVFGMPGAHDDDAVRAVDAGLELRDRVRADPVLAGRIAVHLGVATGEVVASRDAAGSDFLVTGDAVNTAARLQQRAEPWEVLVSDRSVRATGDRFSWGPVRRPRVGAQRRLIARPALDRATAARRRGPPLVDREADLRELELIAERCVAERRPYLVTLVAPAGTGKTRLVEEFVSRSLPSIAPEARVAVAQCLPYGDQLTYGPMGSLLGALLGLPSMSWAEALRPATARWLEDAGVGDPVGLAEHLLASLGQGEGRAADRSTLFAAWRTTLEAAAAERPLVLVLEDLHWSTESLLDLIEYVLAPHGPDPILGIVLARPELLDRRPRWGGSGPNSLVLALPPLPDAAVARLVDLHLGRHVPSVVGSVRDRADGNPFFVGELVRAIRDQASLDDEASIGRALERLPDTVQGTMLARIDLLGPEARRALQLGSVFGRRFTRQGVLALDPSLATDIARTLEGLEEHEVIAADAEGAIVFRHMLLRDVAYQTLTRGDRAALHAGAAAWIEAGAEGRLDEVAELIAHHRQESVAQARAAGMPDDREARRAATTWLRRAAIVDLRGAAGPEAARHLVEAIESAEPDELPGLFELLGDARVIGEEAATAYAHAQEAAGPDASVDDRLRLIGKRIAVETRWQGAMARRRSETELDQLVAEGESLVAQATDRAAIGGFLVACGFLPYWRVGGGLTTTEEETARRRVGTERGLVIAREIRDAALESAALDALSGVAQSLGRHEEAWSYARQRLALAGQLPLGERIDACAFCAWESSVLGEFQEVVRVTHHAAELMVPFAGLAAAVHVMAWRAHALAMLGDWDEALVAADAAERSWSDTGRGAAGYAAQGFLAALEISRSREDEAGSAQWRGVLEESCAPFEEASFARAALSIARLDRDALVACVTRPSALVERPHFVERALATCLDRGWLVQEEPLLALLAEARMHGLRPLEAQVRRGMGLVGTSPTELRSALRLSEAMSTVPMVGRLEVELGSLTGNAQLIDRGMERLRRLGDRHSIGSHVPTALLHR